jgi:hypothetical protein
MESNGNGTGHTRGALTAMQRSDREQSSWILTIVLICYESLRRTWRWRVALTLDERKRPVNWATEQSAPLLRRVA